jgi:heptaprenyl diphosphate synthase
VTWAPPAAADPVVAESVASGLAAVEERLREVVRSSHPLLSTSGVHLVEAGGKRFRPTLVLLCGMLGGLEASDPRLVDAGVVVELVHLSTLYHDDVIDTADARRGAPAAHVKWSNTVAILVGDHLLAKASELSADLGVEVTRIMARTIADLCSGQIREVLGSREAELHGSVRITPDREHYLQVIGEKTASLIASSCRLGALLSGQSPDALETLTDFGWRLGMSFQLADDVLDIASLESESGKVPGTDLREGVLTMPVLLALEDAGPSSELARLIADPTDANVDAALALLRDHPALELARDAARLQATAAKQALAQLTPPDDLARVIDGLAWLADYAADRAG